MPTIETQTDTLNEFEWTTITSTFDENGIITSRYTVLDRGIDILDAYTNGVLARQFRTDPIISEFGNSRESWTTQETLYDLTTGNKTLFHVVYDDTTERLETFDAVTRKYLQIVQTDPEDVKNWDVMTTYYNSNGRKTTRVREDDNGVVATDYFGIGGGTTETVFEDRLDAVNWDMRTIDYISASSQHLITTYFDDGIERRELHQNNRPIQVEQLDTQDVKPWRSILTDINYTFNEEKRTTIGDDGISTKVTTRDGTVRSEIVEDLENVETWDRQSTYYDPNGLVSSQSQRNDDGSETISYFQAGVLEKTIQFQAPDATGYRVRLDTSFNVDGTVSETVSIATDGTTITETFNFSRLTQRVETDGSADAQWVARTSTFDPSGTVIVEITTEYADGQIKTKSLSAAGELVETRIVDASPDGLLKSWTQIDTTYDSSANVASRSYVFDNGVTRTDTFVGGERIRTEQSDLEDVYAWTTTRTDYNLNFDRATTTKVYDNGLNVRISQNADGSKSVSQKDFGDIYDWTDRNAAFSVTGNKFNEVINYDDGLRITKVFSGEIETSRKEQDLGNTEDWLTRETYYIPQADRQGYTVVYDNGDRLNETTENGDLKIRTFTDVSDSEVWSSRTEGFEDGVQVSLTVRYDDNSGVDKDVFEDGRLVQSTKSDWNDRHAWRVMVTDYEDNVVQTREFYFDDTTVRTDTYQNGVRSETVSTDPTDVRNWEMITTTFDATGTITQKTTLSDNGVQREENYVDGVRKSTIQEDRADEFIWDTVRTVDVDGQSMRRTEFDDGDQTAFLFQDGTRVLRVDYDEAGEQLWMVRTTSYTDGTPVVSTYDDLVTVPQDYLDLLNFDQLIA